VALAVAAGAIGAVVWLLTPIEAEGMILSGAQVRAARSLLGWALLSFPGASG